MLWILLSSAIWKLFLFVVYKDTNTKSPFVEDFRPLGDDGEAERTAKPDHIYMDSNAFGGGCCALHVTEQASDIDEARLLYDQLTPICPLMVRIKCEFCYRWLWIVVQVNYIPMCFVIWILCRLLPTRHVKMTMSFDKPVRAYVKLIF